MENYLYNARYDDKLCAAARIFLKSEDNIRQLAREEFTSIQNDFDRSYRKAERKFKLETLNETRMSPRILKNSGKWLGTCDQYISMLSRLRYFKLVNFGVSVQ